MMTHLPLGHHGLIVLNHATEESRQERDSALKMIAVEKILKKSHAMMWNVQV